MADTLSRRLSSIAPLVLLVFVALAAGTGCGRRAPYVPTLQVPRRVAVLDLNVADGLRKVPQERLGWWFGSRSVYYDENVGRTIADELARVLSALPYVELHSRQDYRFYISSKRRLLETAFKPTKDTDVEFLPVDYDRMIEQVDPVAIGRELGVDLVVAGSVNDARMSMNRTVYWTWSEVKADFDVYDVRSGQKVATLTLAEEDQLSSPITLVRRHLKAMLPEFDRVLGGAAAAGK